MATIVFGNNDLLMKLNYIVHPRVIAYIHYRIRKSKSKIIVLDAPLLIEAGLDKIVDKIIVVSVTRKEQLKRIKKRDSLIRSDILKRVKTQIPLKLKKCMADFVIDNSSTITNTKKQVGEILKSLVA